MQLVMDCLVDPPVRRYPELFSPPSLGAPSFRFTHCEIRRVRSRGMRRIAPLWQRTPTLLLLELGEVETPTNPLTLQSARIIRLLGPTLPRDVRVCVPCVPLLWSVWWCVAVDRHSLNSLEEERMVAPVLGTSNFVGSLL